jgi:hypothetical protein
MATSYFLDSCSSKADPVVILRPFSLSLSLALSLPRPLSLFVVAILSVSNPDCTIFATPPRRELFRCSIVYPSRAPSILFSCPSTTIFVGIVLGASFTCWGLTLASPLSCRSVVASPTFRTRRVDHKGLRSTTRDRKNRFPLSLVSSSSCHCCDREHPPSRPLSPTFTQTH